MNGTNPAVVADSWAGAAAYVLVKMQAMQATLDTLSATVQNLGALYMGKNITPAPSTTATNK